MSTWQRPKIGEPVNRWAGFNEEEKAALKYAIDRLISTRGKYAENHPDAPVSFFIKAARKIFSEL